MMVCSLESILTFDEDDSVERISMYRSMAFAAKNGLFNVTADKIQLGNLQTIVSVYSSEPTTRVSCWKAGPAPSAKERASSYSPR